MLIENLISLNNEERNIWFEKLSEVKNKLDNTFESNTISVDDDDIEIYYFILDIIASHAVYLNIGLNSMIPIVNNYARHHPSNTFTAFRFEIFILKQ